MERKTHILETEHGSFEMTLVSSKRRRTVALQVLPPGKLIVFYPVNVSMARLDEWLRGKSQWLMDKLKDIHAQHLLSERCFVHGEEHLFLGKRSPLMIGRSKIMRAKLEFDGVQWNILLPESWENNRVAKEVQKLLLNWYKIQAKEIVGSRIFHFSRVMGVEPDVIEVRTQKRVWGNCQKSTKRIHINWQIVLTPIAVIDYVIVHEMCHLFEANHSKRFWNKVAEFMPDYVTRKNWLRDHQMEIIIPTIMS